MFDFLKKTYNFIKKVPKIFWTIPFFLLRVLWKQNKAIGKHKKLSKKLKENQMRRDGEALDSKIKRYNKRRKK